MPKTPTDAPPALELDWLKTLAGALAAVTAAVLLSTLGAAGTLIGAAVGSIAATVGSAVYAQGLARSKHAMLKAQTTALQKVGVAQAEVRRASRHDGDTQDAHLDLADERLAEARDELDVPSPTWRQRLAGLAWRRVGLAAAATFVVAVLAITGFEAMTGHSVSSYTGGSASGQGSTLGGVTDNSGGSSKPDGPQHSHFGAPSESPSQEPSESPSGTPSPTETPSTTSTTPTTPTGTPSPTETPTETPSGATTPTATP